MTVFVETKFSGNSNIILHNRLCLGNSNIILITSIVWDNFGLIIKMLMVIWRLRTKCNHCTIDYAYESQKTCTPSYNQHSLACKRTPSKEDVVALLVIG